MAAEHDYECDCAECEAAMHASIDRLNATLDRIAPGAGHSFVITSKGKYPPDKPESRTSDKRCAEFGTVGCIHSGAGHLCGVK